MKPYTPETVEQGLDELIDFVDQTLAPQYGHRITAAIVTEFARATPRTVLAMASPSEPDDYIALRSKLVEMLEQMAKDLAVQDAIDVEKAKQDFELLFMPVSARIS